jgi:hypothetical protein
VSAKLIQVIVTDIECRGRGDSPADPMRRITQYWSTDGELLAEVDPCSQFVATIGLGGGGGGGALQTRSKER